MNSLPPPDDAASTHPVQGCAVSAGASESRRNFTTRRGMVALSMVMFLGLGMRLWLMLTPGLAHEDDQRLFLSWVRSLHEHGIGGFFGATSFCDYPPLALLILRVMGQVASWFGDALFQDAPLAILIKIPAVLADMGIAVLLFVEGRRLLGVNRAIGASALYFLNPLSIYHSAYWGQVDSIHAALALTSLILVSRQRWGWAGAFAAGALLQKLQSIAFVPLIILELYRRGRWTAIARAALAALAVGASIGAPFAIAGRLDDVFQRAYIQVIGQYPQLSKNAYNLWYLTGSPDLPDDSLPRPLALAAADGQVSVSASQSWMARLTWRAISLALFTLTVATILSVYSLRPAPIRRFAAAGLLGLAFFLFPTEIHERYALAAIAFLPLWGASSAWRERVFVLLSALLLLNISAVLPASAIGVHIAGAQLLLFAALLAWMAFSERAAVSARAAYIEPPIPEEPPAPPSALIRWFRRGTCAALVAAAGVSCLVVYLCAEAGPGLTPDSTVYVSSLRPLQESQGWGQTRVDASVLGGVIHLGDTFYLRGLGTHAQSRHVYSIPPDADRFEAVVGINRAAVSHGSAVATIEVDGREAYRSPVLKHTPVTVCVPVSGGRELTLRTDPTADGPRGDHVDWALARFVRQDEADSIGESREPRP